MLINKQGSTLKFDTSQANINCFIRGNSPQYTKYPDFARSQSNKRKSRAERKHPQFQDRAFLSSVVCKILNDVDSDDIRELIDDMVFPSSLSKQQMIKQNRGQQIQEQQIRHLFNSFKPNCQGFSRQYPQKNIMYEYQKMMGPYYYLQNRFITGKHEQVTEASTNLSGLFLNSNYANNNVNQDMYFNPQIDSNYQNYYNYVPGCGYQRQPLLRKRKTVSGQQMNEFKIIPQQIQQDGRTTLMIRHIPNKYTQQMLLQQIGKNHRLKINFLYLPIDMYNSCNVGYAFVNFLHTKFILDFYHQFNGRKWDRFNSQKICQLAYARIQGTANLMDHFQTAQSKLKCQKGDDKKKSMIQLDQEALKDISKIVEEQKN